MASFSRILIVGAGGFAREVYWWMQSHADRCWANSFAGFLDDDRGALAGFTDYAPGIIDSISGYQPQPCDRLVMAIADPTTKLKLADNLRDRGAEFATFVHSNTIVVPNARIGYGSVLCPGSGLSCDTKIGEFVTMNTHSGIGHDGEAGDGCTLSAHTEVMGKAKLGRGVFMGSHASILPGVSVGDFAKIGANSVVIRNVRPGNTMMGVPASRLDFRSAPSTPPEHRAA
jgi:sugar O-acyltransferase (sialic acid O-acetyltransferase NeuD family)